MSNPLPIPMPPADASWREQFDYAVALQRHDDMVAQTAAINAQVAQSASATQALQAATTLQTAIANPTNGDLFWQAMMCQFNADNHGADTNNTVRNHLGIDWMASKAKQALDKRNELFPPAP